MDLSDLFAENVDDRIDIERAIGRLDHREAAVLYLWACCECTQKEVGEILNLSQSTIHRILANMNKNIP